MAILCGVAVGLISVALAVILVVRGRAGAGGAAAEELNEGDACLTSSATAASIVGAGSGDGDGRGRYDAVSTKDGPEESDNTPMMAGGADPRQAIYVERQITRCAGGGKCT